MEGRAGPAFSADRTRVSGRRFVAHLADGVLYALLFVVLILIAGATNDVVLAVTFVLGFTVLHVAYFVVLQRRSARTPGKALVAIRAVDAAGGVPSTRALVKRTLPLPIEYFYVIALLGCSPPSTGSASATAGVRRT